VTTKPIEDRHSHLVVVSLNERLSRAIVARNIPARVPLDKALSFESEVQQRRRCFLHRPKPACVSERVVLTRSL
jgi:hypothetical protein